MLRHLFRSAAAWTAVGLAGGLAYREVTRQHGFTGPTQLALVHTHALALGTTVMLVLLGLAGVFRTLDRDARFRWGVHLLNGGLTLTVAMLAVKGYLQVVGAAWAGSPALAGVSGLGHMTMTLALVLLLLALGRAVRDAERPTFAGAPADGATELVEAR